jgi:quercetin dioxygenase-like cupin family protein
MSKTSRKIARLSESTAVENPPGIRRTALAYEKDIMLCHFSMKKGAEISLHNHAPAFTAEN